MRKNVFGRQLKRDTNERKALFKGLMSALVLKERIKTTEEKAKAIRGQVEKLVTKAKKKGQGASSLLSSHLLPGAVEKVIKDLAPRFKTRPGGYTRIVKLGRRFGDDAMTVLMEWVEQPKIPPKARLATGGKNVEAIMEEEVKKKSERNVKIKRAVITKPKTKIKKVKKEVKK
ncbi:MAG: 50S ribosomal protein L17 [bacterium]|nr:50S ribosomal protein L17 [bacterium]